VTFAGSGDAFGSDGRLQACIVVRAGEQPPILGDLDQYLYSEL
jgi:hypothetical protein